VARGQDNGAVTLIEGRASMVPAFAGMTGFEGLREMLSPTA